MFSLFLEQIHTDFGARLCGRPDHGRHPKQPEATDHAESVLLHELFPQRAADRGVRLCVRKDRRPYYDVFLDRQTEGALNRSTVAKTPLLQQPIKLRLENWIV